jgi:hypothetical protein
MGKIYRLALLLIALIVSTSLMAQTADEPSGSGTEASPYQIETLNNLYWITQNSTEWSKYYEQTANIDATSTSTWDGGAGFTPIGYDYDHPFTGNYDGQNYTISNLYINRPSTDCIGLFGYSLALINITNIGLLNCDITGNNSTGSIVGYFATNSPTTATTISDSYSTGTISGNSYVGGLVGQVVGNVVTINYSYSTCSVGGNRNVGGLVGGFGNGIVSNCYSNGDVTRKSGASSTWIGGFCGYIEGTTIECCYSIGSVFYEGVSDPTDKGFAGGYGMSSGSQNANYFDSEASNQNTDAMGAATPKTTAEMKTQATFTGWDFTSIWSISVVVNNGYPYLYGYTWTGLTNTDWNNTANWSENSIPTSTKNIIIPDVTNDPIITSIVSSECNNITIESGGSLTISEEGKLTVNDDLSNSGTLTINTYASSTGSLIVEGTASGDISMQRYIATWSDADHGWHFLSSPVASQAINDFHTVGSGNDFYKWDEINDIWVNRTASGGGLNGAFETNFAVGTGYLIANSTTSTKTFSGTLNNSNIDFSNLSYTEATDHTGWHLLGNPYPSALLWDATAWNRTNVNATAKIWHESNSSYSDISQNGAIPANQGFMINVTSATNSITIPLDDRSHNSQNWYKNGETNKIKLTAYDTEGNTAQESIIKFNENATTGFDNEYDSKFLSGYAPLFYSQAGEFNVSSNTLPEITEELSILIYFIKNGSSTYYIEVEGIENLLTDYPIYLTDLKTGHTQKLSDNPVYSFTSSEGDSPHRFLLHFKAVGIEEHSTSNNNIQIWSANKTVNIFNPDNHIGQIRVLNMFGQILAEAPLDGNSRQLFTVNIPAGYYIVNIINQHFAISKKVFVK